MLRLLSILVLFFHFCSLLAQDLPHNSGAVVDQVGIFSSADKRALIKSLHQVKKQSKTEIQIVIIKTLAGQSIEEFSIRLADKWKIGDAKNDRGVIFLVAMNDRKMRIEVGDGLEGELTDLEASRIIRSVTPYFKKARYRDGIISATAQIIQKVGGKLEGTYVPKTKKVKKSNLTLLIIILFLFIVFSGRSRGLGGRGYYSSGSRGSSSGGFGSFGGGGSFSGGGASGGW